MADITCIKTHRTFPNEIAQLYPRKLIETGTENAESKGRLYDRHSFCNLHLPSNECSDANTTDIYIFQATPNGLLMPCLICIRIKISYFNANTNQTKRKDTDTP